MNNLTMLLVEDTISGYSASGNMELTSTHSEQSVDQQDWREIFFAYKSGPETKSKTKLMKSGDAFGAESNPDW